MSDWERIEDVRVTCRGTVAARTSYLIDIKTVDAAVREALIPIFDTGRQSNRSGRDTLAAVWPELARKLRANDVELTRLRWNRSPYDSLEMTAPTQAAVLHRQKFDFAAAHRLHNPALSDDENRRLYGKCNNPRGHGHNYQFEPCIEISPSAASFSALVVEGLCRRVILDRFDHKNLNEDTAEFREPSGLNPSVENIAAVFFGLLAGEVSAAIPGCTLLNMTVWETDRTCATYPA